MHSFIDHHSFDDENEWANEWMNEWMNEGVRKERRDQIRKSQYQVQYEHVYLVCRKDFLPRHKKKRAQPVDEYVLMNVVQFGIIVLTVFTVYKKSEWIFFDTMRTKQEILYSLSRD